MTSSKLRKKNTVFELLNSKVFDINKIHGLQNLDGTSCYSDCVLFSLLAIPDNFINKHMFFSKIKHYNITKSQEKIRNIIQKYIIKLAISIRFTNDIKTCQKFRTMLNICQLNGMPNFGKHGQQESGEFLSYLFTIFNINNIAKTRTINFATNNLTSKVTQKELIQTSVTYDKKASPIVFIDPFKLNGKLDKNNLIYYFLKQFTDSGELTKDNKFIYKVSSKNIKYSRTFSYMTVMDSPYIVFWAQRANPIDNSIIRTNITPTQQITLNSKRVLYLNSIILHIGNISGGHYITYFRHNIKWYLYDDINSNIIYIGNYFKMLETTPNPCTNGVLYFYS